MRKKMKVEDMRAANILPSSAIEENANRDIKAIRIGRRAFGKQWNKAEKYIEIDFVSSENDDRAGSDGINAICASCGENEINTCCKNIPKNQIGIYMSDTEKKFAESQGYDIKVQHSIVSDGVLFWVLDVEENGDCSMLGRNDGDNPNRSSGCTLGNFKPMWCKAYYCEMLYGGDNPYTGKILEGGQK